MKTIRILLLLVAALFALPAVAEDFSLPERYWPDGFAWEEHHYSGWTGASIFRPGRSDPTEFPVVQFSTPGIPANNRIGGRIHASAEYAIEFQARVTRKGPVASSVPDAECHEGWSNEAVDRDIRWSSGLQFNCRIGRMTFYVDLRSQSNSDPTRSGNGMLNEAVPLTVLHEVATSIVAGYRQYAVDNGLLEPTNRITAALFPNPEEDLPESRWWAKSAGAIYERHGAPAPLPGSWTPSWLQTIEVSAAQGYVFKSYGSDGSGSWCRPEKYGKCDLPFQRVSINIQDFMMHGGQEHCLKSLEAMLQSGGNRTRVSDSKYSFRANDQFGLNFCRNGFHVSVGSLGLEEPAVPSVAEYYAAVVERRIDSGGGSLPSGNAATPPPVPGTQAEPGQPGLAGDLPGGVGPDGATPGGYPSSNEGATISPVAIATSAIAVGGIAGVGAWLMLGQAGIGRREALGALGELARGRLPSDGFDDWKAKYEALGWTYREENGVAVFDPPPGHDEQAAATPPPVAVHRAGEVNPDTGEVWSEEDRGWVGRELYEKERARAGEIAAIEERNRQSVAAWDAETQALDTAIAASARDRAARAAAEEAARTRIGDKLTRLYEEQGLSTGEIERLRREGDTGGLEDLYEDAIRERMAKTSAEAAAYEREARLYHAGELASRAVLAGAKAGMMVVAGPAGYIPAAVGSGVLRSAEEGAGAWVASGGDKAKLGSALVSGFFAGAKDGVVGRFASLPRTGTATKILLPAGADATETYVRTGDIAATVSTAVLSATGGAAGSAFDAAGNVIAREAGQAATGAALGAAGSLVNGGSLSEGALNGLVDAVGGRAGQHIGSLNTPMSHDEIRMDLEHAAKVADARERIDTLKSAIAGGDEAAVKLALKDVLDHREAKQLMGGDDVDPALRRAFGDLTEEHRTKPVMEGTAGALNAKTVTGPDGTEQPRFVVRDANGVERPVTGGDFASGSASAGNKPGMDLDMYPKETIIDKTTGQPARRADIESAVTESCDRLGIDPHAQEVNVTGMKGKEDWVMREGETPEQFTARIQRDQSASAAEGTSISEVATAKLNEASERHGAGAGSSAVAEHARTVIKDKGRLIDHLIAGDSKAQVPEVFRRQDPVSGETPLTILKKVADGTMPPGSGNAKFRAMTGMDITEATPKIASWAEPLGKWGAGAPGNATPPPSFTGPGAGANLQQTVASAIKDAADKKGGE